MDRNRKSNDFTVGDLREFMQVGKYRYCRYNLGDLGSIVLGWFGVIPFSRETRREEWGVRAY